MAAKKKTTEETTEQRTATVATEQAAEQAAPEEEVHGEQTGPEQTPEAAEVPETPSDPKEDVADAAPDDTAPKLENLSVLADRHRVEMCIRDRLCVVALLTTQVKEVECNENM